MGNTSSVGARLIITLPKGAEHPQAAEEEEEEAAPASKRAGRETKKPNVLEIAIPINENSDGFKTARTLMGPGFLQNATFTLNPEQIEFAIPEGFAYNPSEYAMLDFYVKIRPAGTTEFRHKIHTNKLKLSGAVHPPLNHPLISNGEAVKVFLSHIVYLMMAFNITCNEVVIGKSKGDGTFEKNTDLVVKVLSPFITPNNQ